MIPKAIQEPFKTYRMERKEELSELAEILYKADVCIDMGPLNTCIAACLSPPQASFAEYDKGKVFWGYELVNLPLALPDQRHLRPRKALTDGLAGYLSVTVEEYIPLTVESVGHSFDSVRRLVVDFHFDSIVDLRNGETHDLRAAWHVDTHVYKNQRDCHPRFHFQFGGDKLEEVDDLIRAVLVPEAPRLATAPMDAVLAVDFVLSHYFGELWQSLRDSEPRYRRLIRAAMVRYWRDYFRHMAAFINDPDAAESEHPACKLHPNLI